MKLTSCKFNEENEGEGEQSQPPREESLELGIRDSSEEQTHEETLSDRSTHIGVQGFGTQKPACEREQSPHRYRTETGPESQEKQTALEESEGVRIRPKNENAEGAEGHEREETDGDEDQ